ncbi:sugar ABC transporter substrate-binding protein [Jannaschia pagri]|uniref:Sugar ABC transporter substrate-binding protein n=1 Tax=Jannaschia pagri TaxID=2829797 RepID=A0ABQ4NIR8_9RHOB|nr:MULTISPECIES: substrate-binding domain-containing protein [unclassified Jannaschia]GIT89578.1 sugar ABC transporter substrate-binding protein [Jannaschia sp. AI_61]GIT94314.1 sugar ABC transporter substrate-binding protein [Jannaschia sp. AI_62]
MLKRTLLTGVAAMIALPAFADGHAAKIEAAMESVAKYAGPKTEWDGPTEGPAAMENARIVVLAGDLKNGGILGVTKGVEEAAAAAGWSVNVLDGAGSVQSRAAAFGQAFALQPDGIIINGFDSTEQQAAIEQAAEAGIPMVAWHSGPVIGCDPGNGIFANVSTDAMEVSAASAQWAFADADGEPGVVIFTDSTFQIAIAKADRIKEEIEALGGTVLEYVDTPIADTSNRMPTLTTALLQRHGAAWTHSLAINDIYFDFMGPSLASAGIAGDARPLAVAAGDGSESAYQRIRAGQYQAVTVAEPLNLQGWQLVDELNRAMQGAECSGYLSPLHVVTAENIALDGGDDNIFDPGNGYRDVYKGIWGVE